MFTVSRPAKTLLLVLSATLVGVGCGDKSADSADPLAGIELITEDPSDSPLAGISEEWMERFDEGDATFEATFRSTQGLGPVYIRDACASCHADDGRGPGTVIKMIVPDDPVLDAELLPFGHTERPYVSGGATTPLLAPEDERVWLSTRSPPAVFGRGWMEAIDEATIRGLVEEQAAAGRVSGRVNEVPCDFEENAESLFPGCTTGDTVLGRFGLKARVPTLDGFAADAYQGDMAITSPMRPVELNNPDGLDDDDKPGIDIDLETVNFTGDYMRLLAIPPREEAPGADLLEEAGCAECHRASLPTRADWPVPELAGKEAAIYSDLLLHDMGEGFSDGLSDHDAAPSEWRTAPLIGLRHLRNLLHDGRAETVEEATLAHGATGSEAAFSVDLFLALSEADQAALIAFVETL